MYLKPVHNPFYHPRKENKCNVGLGHRFNEFQYLAEYTNNGLCLHTYRDGAYLISLS